jgi:hypothetical protein
MCETEVWIAMLGVPLAPPAEIYRFEVGCLRLEAIPADLQR